jgi:hypothetical protein
MTRLKLFLFFTAMAWTSLVCPRHGRRLLADAEDGAAARGKGTLLISVGQQPAPVPRRDGGLLFIILAACALTLIWLVILGSALWSWAHQWIGAQ